MSIPASTGVVADPVAMGPIADTDLLYRRLLPGGWYRNQADPIIPQRYFMPRPWQSNERPGDTDGISVNRATLINEIEASKRPDTGERVPMARFVVTDVRRIGLSVRPAPLPNDVSHAVIPELNSLDRRDAAKEKRMEEWALALRNCSVLIRPA